MKTNRASRTAQYMAFFRALESLRAAGTKLFDDPWARHFLKGTLRYAVAFAGWTPIKKLIFSWLQEKIPGAYASAVARTKYIDDLLLEAIRNGTQQIIILGAGYDTRALRLPELKNIPIFEIDHPNTSASKLTVLKALDIMPLNVQYLQIDFNKESLDQLLTRQNVDTSLRTTIIWEGVTNYLTEQAVQSTFVVLGKFGHGSSVIFTYVHLQVLENPNAFYGGEKLLRDLGNIDENWTFGMLPESVSDFLGRFNLLLAEDHGAKNYRERYIPERRSISKGYEFYRVCLAKAA